MASKGLTKNQGHSKQILKVFLVKTNPQEIQFGCFITSSISHMQEDNKQHCKYLDEIGFCSLMFLMEKEVHVIKTGKIHTTH